MTSSEILERYLYSHVSFFGLHFLVLHGGRDVHTTGASDNELAHCLIVDIEQDVALQRIFRQVVHAIHAGLFICRNKRFQRSVYQIRSFQHSHDGCHTDSVISTQSGAFGLYPIAVNICFNGICLKIMGTLIQFLGYHIHMRLQNSNLSVFHSRSRGFAHHDILGIVLEGFNASFCRPVQQELLNRRKMAAGTGHLGQQIEITPNRLRCKIFD